MPSIQLPGGDTSGVLDQFIPENVVYGFAVWALLHPSLQQGFVLNQKSDHDDTAPQCIIAEFDIDCPDIPPDVFQYGVMVTLDSSRAFYEQESFLIVTDATRNENTTYCTETTYRLPFGSLLEILPRLQKLSVEILPCIPILRFREFTVDVD